MSEIFDPRPKRIDSKGRKELEMIIGYKMCPFSAFQQRHGPKRLSAYDDNIVCVYICGRDLGIARGGLILKYDSFEGAMTPCNLSYALTCTNFRTN